jgi:hypothetical protein
MLTLRDRTILDNVGGENTSLHEVPVGEVDELRRSVNVVREAFPDTMNLPLHLRGDDPQAEEVKP